jgi:hypothetical protein
LKTHAASQSETIVNLPGSLPSPVDEEEATFILESISTGSVNTLTPVLTLLVLLDYHSFGDVMLMDLFIILQLFNVSWMILLRMNLNSSILLILELVIELKY